ncbi:T6SS immunity protein Tdi1 domain-containing protein [Frigoribacterium sp. SL97]|uniref:T6SS immunity protein Tdi1 domain-containing protein n=1 Tax=Frigoribacterium sp. SL97 TaxID=2994664 RepID=UPI003B63E6E4
MAGRPRRGRTSIRGGHAPDVVRPRRPGRLARRPSAPPRISTGHEPDHRQQALDAPRHPRLRVVPGRPRLLRLEPLPGGAGASRGVPRSDECFGFSPLLALGGRRSAASLEVVDMREHVLLISSVAGPLP